MSKFYNLNTCSEEEVWIVLLESKKFGWSWCKDRAEPFRHTAIILYFDDNPHFTINFRTEDGASKAACAFSEVKELITIESLADTDYQCFPALEEFSVWTPFGKQRAKDRIQSIVSYQPGSYNLFFNNCRDHVKGVVKHFLGKEVMVGQFEDGMSQIQSEDTVRKLAAASTAVAGTGVTVWGVSKIVSYLRKNNEEEEQH